MVRGPPGSLREELAHRVRELRAGDPLSPITVLVGASLQRPFLQRWLAARLGAHANVRILMPGDLALAARCRAARGRRDAERCRRLADRVLLADVSRKHPGYFAPVAETPGFGEALFRLVRELRGAGYDLSDLGPLLDGATDAPEKAGSLAGDPRRVRAAPVRLLRPRRCAGGRRFGSRSTGLRCFIWGMLDMPPALERLLRQDRRADAGRGVLARGSCGRRRAARRSCAARLSPAEPLRGRSAESREAGTRRSRVVRRATVHRPGEAGDPEPDGTLRLVSAPDPSREVRAAARACLEWAREGVPFWEMAVAYRHGEAYRPLVEAVFVEAGIPVYLHEGSPLAERPVGRQTLGLLALYRQRAVAAGR